MPPSVSSTVYSSWGLFVNNNSDALVWIFSGFLILAILLAIWEVVKVFKRWYNQN